MHADGGHTGTGVGEGGCEKKAAHVGEQGDECLPHTCRQLVGLRARHHRSHILRVRGERRAVLGLHHEWQRGACPIDPAVEPRDGGHHVVHP